MALALTPSLEQENILSLIEKGHNVVGDCVAGSGKTTSVLLLAKAFPLKRILQVTYNSQLKFEVRQKAIQLGLQNIEIHTYNSLCVKYYHNMGYTNDILRTVIKDRLKPRQPIPKTDILVLDETQDMNFLFYGLIKKFIADSKTPVHQLLVLGDRYQGIYKFIGADARYLTLAHCIWGRKFLPATLTTSYRLTFETASFVNEVMLGHKRIQSVRSGPKVLYKVCNPYKIHKSICEELRKHLKTVKADDIFVLAGSIKGSQTPIRLLENELASYGIPCYYPVSDDKKLDEDIIEGKVVFSTFHQAKGRERKIVIVYGFDDGYFKFYGQEYNPLVCPETLYVATTRAKERLILLHDKKFPMLPFLQVSFEDLQDKPYMEVEGILEDTAVKPQSSTGVKHNTSPTDLVQYLKEANIQLLNNIADQIFSQEEAANYMIDIPSKIAFEEGNYEDVSDINGLAIPAMYESQERGDSQVECVTRQEYENILKKNEHPFLREAYKRLGNTIKTPLGFVRLTVLYISLVEKIYHKVNQISRHDWLKKSMVEGCFRALKKHITDDAMFEIEIDHASQAFPEYGTVEVRGRMDTLDDHTVLELKCVDALTLEHKLQLVVYAWMWREEIKADRGSRQFKLVNMRTGEVFKLNAESHLLDEAMRVLLHNKYAKIPELLDAEFIEQCTMEIKKPSGNSGSAPLFIDDD